MTDLDVGSTLSLQTLGGLMACRVEDATSEASPHTGRDLTVLRLSTTVPANAGEAVAEVIRGAASPDKALADAAGRRWVVTTHSSSYSPGGPHHFSVGMKQVEEVRANEVRIGDLLLTPVSYEEHIDDQSGAVVITMRCSLDTDQLAAWRAILDARTKKTATYYPVERVGVETVHRSMRPGRPLWMRRDEGIEAKVVLVEAVYDQVDRDPFPGFGEPDLSHALRWAATTAAQSEVLVTELSQAGLLTPEAVQRIQEAGEGALKALLWDVAEVEDLDEFGAP